MGGKIKRFKGIKGFLAGIDTVIPQSDGGVIVDA